jgi:hypothetical protein
LPNEPQLIIDILVRRELGILDLHLGEDLAEIGVFFITPDFESLLRL